MSVFNRVYNVARKIAHPVKRKLETKVGKHVIRESIQSYASDQPFTLDIGCGSRVYETHFPKMIGMDIVNHGGAHVIGDAHGIPFQDNTFDLVICSEVIEHLKDPKAAISEISRVLGAGGMLIATIPFVYPIHEAPHDYQRYTEYGLRELIGGKFVVRKIAPLYSEEQTLAILLQRISFQRRDRIVRYYSYLALAHLIFRLDKTKPKQRFQDLGRTVPGTFLTADYLVIGENR